MEEFSNSLIEDKGAKFIKVKAALFKHRTILLICLAAIVLAVVCYTIHMNKVKRLQEEQIVQELQDEYKSAIDIYNAEIEKYNTEVERVEEIRKFLSEISDNELPQKSAVKSTVPYDFETYHANGDDINGILHDTEQCKLEYGKMIEEYNQLCVVEYNAKVNLYNEDIKKYNSMLQRLSVYDISMQPDNVQLMDVVGVSNSELVNRWRTTQNYIDDINKIISNDDEIKAKYFAFCVRSYNDVICDYNIIATEYNKLLDKSSIAFIDGLAPKAKRRTKMELQKINTINEDWLCNSMDKALADMENLAGDYVIVSQITNPNQQWVLDKLKNIQSITDMAAVTKNKDPNGLLGKEGGYTACIYFGVKDVDSNLIRGASVIDKGTDAGGAIEVYEDSKSALRRCDYLSQFDGTLLYTGSYTVVGTMVVRTSYKLSNAQQVELIDAIIQEFTK